MVYIVIIFSFFFDSLFTNLIPTTFTNLSFLMPFFTIISIVLVYPYFKNDRSYYITAFVTGLIYDIAYTNTLFLNALIFITIALIVKLLNKHFNRTLIFNIILSFGILIYYQILTFFLLTITGQINYQILTIVMIFISSIVVNIIYAIAFYLILKKALKQK